MSFTESSHPRDTSGRFAAKPRPESGQVLGQGVVVPYVEHDPACGLGNLCDEHRGQVGPVSHSGFAAVCSNERDCGWTRVFDTEGEASSAASAHVHETPTWSKVCGDCGQTIERYRGQGDISCPCGAEYNAFGQRLRDNWRSNPSWGDEEIGDLEGFELAALASDME